MNRLIINGIDFDEQLDMTKQILHLNIETKWKREKNKEDFWCLINNFGIYMRFDNEMPAIKYEYSAT